MGGPQTPTRCAFIVCKVLKCGEPHLLLVRDTRWGDLTLVGGHEERADNRDLERTARREVEEELGRIQSPFQLIPLTDEITYGPTWSKSGKKIKSYVFKYFGIQFEKNPQLPVTENDKGFAIEMIKESELFDAKDLSNVVKILLEFSRGDLSWVPVSWEEQAEKSPSTLENLFS